MSISLKDDILKAVRESRRRKTGVTTPKFRKPTVPPQPTVPPMPPTSGSNAVKPKKSCPYETPCGWCTKWDKKCDKKIKHTSKTSQKPQPPCFRCESYEYGDPKCPTCKKENYKFFEAKEK